MQVPVVGGLGDHAQVGMTGGRRGRVAFVAEHDRVTETGDVLRRFLEDGVRHRDVATGGDHALQLRHVLVDCRLDLRRLHVLERVRRSDRRGGRP